MQEMGASSVAAWLDQVNKRNAAGGTKPPEGCTGYVARKSEFVRPPANIAPSAVSTAMEARTLAPPGSVGPTPSRNLDDLTYGMKVDESRHSCTTLSIKRIKEGLQTKYLADLTNHVF